MMIKRYTLAKSLIIIAVMLVSPAVAFDQLSFYRAQVQVSDRSNTVRQAALKQALAVVFAQTSADQAALQSPQVQQLLNDPTSLVSRYAYRQLQDTPAEIAMDNTAPPPVFLEVQFDPEGVNNALKAASLPIWANHRPTTIAWVAFDNGLGNRQLLGEHALHGMMHTLKQVITQTAAAKGAPVMFPLLDLSDKEQVSASDVWGQFSQPIKQASIRYQSDVIWMVSVSQLDPMTWQARWQLLLGDEVINDEIQATSVNELAVLITDRLVSLLAKRYQVTSDSNEQITVSLSVNEVRGPKDYAKLMAYLGTLSQISNIQLNQMGNGQVLLDVDAAGGTAALKRAIELDHVLTVNHIDTQEMQLTLGARG